MIAAITQVEGSLDAAIVKALETAPRPNGLLGLVFPQIEGSLESYATQLIAQHGAPTVLFALLDSSAHRSAKSLGG
ncbi:MAG: hypothetical protein NVS3B5_19610 [Sphingomicrobium sp.]